MTRLFPFTSSHFVKSAPICLLELSCNWLRCLTTLGRWICQFCEFSFEQRAMYQLMTHDVRGRGQSRLASGCLPLAEEIQKTTWQKVPAWALEGWPWALTWEQLSWRTHKLALTWEIKRLKYQWARCLGNQEAGWHALSTQPLISDLTCQGDTHQGYFC